MRKVVTTYINPDMDGISLMYAYTEFLRKKGEDAEYYFEGTMKKEAEIVLEKFNIHLNNITRIENSDKIVLVDTNPNLKIQIEDQFMTISWSMGQLEVANVDDFLNKYENDIRKILDTVSEENDVDYISVNCMDIINGYSIIVARDEKTAKVISDAVGFVFKDLKAKTTELVSRKEIVKVIRGIYKK